MCCQFLPLWVPCIWKLADLSNEFEGGSMYFGKLTLLAVQVGLQLELGSVLCEVNIVYSASEAIALAYSTTCWGS